MRTILSVLVTLWNAMLKIGPERPALPRVIRFSLHPFVERGHAKVLAGGGRSLNLSRLVRPLIAAAAVVLVLFTVATVAQAGGIDPGVTLAMPGLLTAKELRAKRANLWEQQKEILAKATAEKRDNLTDEETQTWDRIDADLKKLDEQVRRIEAHEERAREMEGVPAPRSVEDSRGQDQPPNPENLTDEQRAVRLHGAFVRWMGYSDEGPQPEDRDVLRAAGFATGKPGEIHFNLRARPMTAAEARAQSLTDASGGYTVPQGFSGELERSMLAFGGMREVARVIRTATGNQIDWPTVDDTSNKGAILAENTQVTEQDITFGNINLDAYKYTSKLIRVSRELLQDSAFDLPSFLASALGERIARITNEHFTTGTGTSQPNGVVTAATSAFTAAAVDAVTYDELIRLIHSVDPAYRRGPGVGFMYSDDSLLQLRKLKDGEGRPLWQAGLQNGEPDRLMGFRYTINQDVADMATTTKSILFGDFNKYIIRDVLGVTLLRLTERYADFYQDGFVAFSRHDGELLDAGTDPIKFITMA